jgi:hypothetical protein
MSYARVVTDDPEARPLFVNLSDAIKVEDSISASPPLVQVVGGSAIYPTTGASPPVVISHHSGSALPDVSLSENAWDLTTSGIGVAVGAVIGHAPGAVVGGAAAYAWGRWRWTQVQKKSDGRS